MSCVVCNVHHYAKQNVRRTSLMKRFSAIIEHKVINKYITMYKMLLRDVEKE